MTLEDQCALSYYKEVGPLNERDDWHLVQDLETGRICLRKKLDVYQLSVYRALQAHPVAGTPRIYLAIEDGGSLIVVEEFLSGTTLSDYLSQKGRLSTDETAEIAAQLCRILQQLHNMNPPIIHRDVKPSNIILSEEGYVRLLDMNAAKEYHGPAGADTKLLGTAGYAAPEQYGFGASDPRTDLYAVGVLMYVMLTGVLPSEQRAGGPLQSVIDRCLQMEPSLRWSSARELEQGIRLAAADKSSKKRAGRTSKAGDTGTKERSCSSDPAWKKKRRGDSPDAAPAESAAPQPASWRRFLPPGFRTGKVWKMAVSALYYFFLVELCAALTMNDAPASPAFRIITFACGLSVVLITCNYLGIQTRLPLARSRHLPVRILGVLFWDCAVPFLLLFIWSAVEVLL